MVPASAQAQTPPGGPTPPAPTPVPPPPPVEGTLALTAEAIHRDGDRRVALTGDRWRVRGVLRPYVPG